MMQWQGLLRSRKSRAIACLLALPGVLTLLFCLNGLLLARGERPSIAAASHAAAALPAAGPNQVKVMAYNIAKGFVYKGGVSFESREAMHERLRRLADVINAEQPDLVFLSEAIVECGLCPVNQVQSLAEATGMHMWAFGEDFNFGLPWFRIVNGNAILSRLPLEAIANPSLAGRQPFYVMKNNRRVLWCATQVGGQRILLASIHTDSFNGDNNLAQTRQLLDFAGDRPAIMAGDFNSTPQSRSMRLLRDSGRFTGRIDGPVTFPSGAPVRTIDYILGPATWSLADHHVVQSEASDHLPVVSTFQVH